MIIKEGSRIQLIEGYDNNVIIDEIITNEDIEVSGGHAILIRVEGCDSNNLFESDNIKQIDEEKYLIRGFFKDALMILKRDKSIGLYQSWMDY